MNLIPSEPVKVALRLRDPAQPDAIHDLGCAIADALPPEQMTHGAFALAARTVLANAAAGKGPARLCGFPPMMYGIFDMALPAIARRVLPPGEDTDAIVAHLEAT